MSTPTTRSFTSAEGGGTAYEITDFVAAVRVQLNDLSADEVTELTGGLEADLTDALAEADSTLSQLYGDPAEYAGELRAAAGLPPRGAVGASSRVAGPGLAVRFERSYLVPMQELMHDLLGKLDAQPWGPGVRDFLVAIRPAWWVLRAWVLVQALFIIGGAGDGAIRGGFGGLVLVLAAIVLSVQLARNAPLPATWSRVLVAGWNVAAVLLVLPILFTSTSNDNGYYEADSGPGPVGLIINGETVNNVFPYDSAGRPLTGVQLFDQTGRPLEVGEGDRSYWNDQDGTSVELVPGSPVGSAPRWNAFPLQQRRSNNDTGELGPVEPAPLPMAGVPSSIAAPGVLTTATSAPAPSAPSPSVSSDPPPPSSEASPEATVGPSASASPGSKAKAKDEKTEDEKTEDEKTEDDAK